MIRHELNVILRLEGMPGSAVKDIAYDMVDACNRLKLPVSLDMNGAHLIAFPNYTTVTDLKRDYEAQIESHPKPAREERSCG